jgi:hypothetical protein
MSINYWQSEGWPEAGSYEIADIGIANAKKHLREKGGKAFTAFFDRKGNLVEKRAIALKSGKEEKTA